MTEYIITQEQVKEINRTHGGMKIVTSWLSCYAIWDTSNTYPVMKSEHIAVTLPEIVRCRDCINQSFDEFGGGWCNENCREVKPWDYCTWAERKGGGE